MPGHGTRILLIRHGQTALNAEGRLRGLADPQLDDVGIRQARAAAKALRPHGIGRVLSSPLRRAEATAAIIAVASGVTSVVDPAFNDRDYGEWTGCVKAEVVRQWGRIDDAPGVEPQSSVLTRALRRLGELADGHGTTSAIVTHDAVIRPILTSIQPGIDPAVDTGSWAEIVRDGESWTIISIDNEP